MGGRCQNGCSTRSIRNNYNHDHEWPNYNHNSCCYLYHYYNLCSNHYSSTYYDYEWSDYYERSDHDYHNYLSPDLDHNFFRDYNDYDHDSTRRV